MDFIHFDNIITFVFCAFSCFSETKNVTLKTMLAQTKAGKTRNKYGKNVYEERPTRKAGFVNRYKPAHSRRSVVRALPYKQDESNNYCASRRLRQTLSSSDLFEVTNISYHKFVNMISIPSIMNTMFDTNHVQCWFRDKLPLFTFSLSR